MQGSLGGLKLLPLLGALGIVLVLGGLLTVQVGRVQQLQAEVRAKQQQLALLEGQTQELLQEVSGLQKDRDALAGRAAGLQQELGVAKQEGEQARLRTAATASQLQQLQAERDQLNGEVLKLTSELDGAHAQLERLKREKQEVADAAKRLRNRLALVSRDYEQAKTRLEQLESRPLPSSSAISIAGPTTGAPISESVAAAGSTIPGTVELPPIIVRRNHAGISSRLQGRVIDVNDAHNFIVIDQGQDHGVYLGMAFDLLRGASTIGRATVIRVRPQLAACDIVRVHTPGSILIGDSAVQRGP